jgi:tetratricopeptide (TPR) repeat protein
MRLIPFLLLGCALVGCQKKVEDPISSSPAEVEEPSPWGEVAETPEAASDGTAETAPVEASSDVATGPALVQAKLDEATAFLTRGDPTSAQAALAILEPLTVEHPDLAGIQYNMGVAYLILDDNLNARKRFLRATEVDSGLTQAWLNMAIMSEQVGDLERALDKIEAGLRYAPDDDDLVVSQIHLLRKMEAFDEAIQKAEQAIQVNGHNLAAYDALGMTYLDKADRIPQTADVSRERANFIYQLAQAFVPGADKSTSIHTNLGRLYLAKEWTSAAQKEFTIAIELDPTAVEPYLYLADIDLDNRDYAAARNRLEKARDLAPHRPGIWVSLGVAYRGLEQSDDAIASYEKAIALDPDNIEPNLNIAVVMADQQKKFDEAVSVLEQYREDGGQSPALAEEWEDQILKAQRRWNAAEKRRLKKEERRKQREEDDRARREAEAAEAEAAEAEAARLAAEAEAAEVAPPTDTGESNPGGGSDTPEVAPLPVPEGETSSETAVGSPDGSSGTPAAEDSAPLAAPDPAGGAPEEPAVAPEDPGPQAAPSSEEASPWATANPEDEATGAVEAELAPSTPDASPAGEEASTGESVTPSPSEAASPWGAAPEPEVAPEGTTSGTACTAIGTCGSDDFECAHDGVCRPSYSIGTLRIGDGCFDDTDCALNLSCTNQICSEPGAAPEASPAPADNPWGVE